MISQLGKPDVTRPCGKNLLWDGDGDYLGRNDGVCVTEDRYEYFLSAWGVSVNRHFVVPFDRVIVLYERGGQTRLLAS